MFRLLPGYNRESRRGSAPAPAVGGAGVNGKNKLPLRILTALAAGVLVGVVCHFAGWSGWAAAYLKPLGDIFVNLLKFLVVPVVLLSMIDGILSMGDLKQVGTVGVRAAAYFLATTAIACVIGLFFASLFQNAGWFPDLQGQLGEAEYEPIPFEGFQSVLVNIFPSNLWSAFASANMLQVIVIALLFGGSILAAGERGELCRDMAGSLGAVMEKLMEFVISLSPLGVFAYMAWITATQGAVILGSLFLVVLCAYLGYGAHGLLVYSLSVRLFAGMSPARFFRGSFAAMAFAFTSASSAAALPVSRQCAQALGAREEVAAFVLPLGATINMDGTAIYQCVATVFIASCAGIRLSLAQMAVVVATATLAAVGTAGVSGAGMIMLAMVLEALGIPVAYIGLIVAVDRLFDMGRTCLNVSGDIACTLCVSKWQGGKRRG